MRDSLLAPARGPAGGSQGSAGSGVRSKGYMIIAGRKMRRGSRSLLMVLPWDPMSQTFVHLRHKNICSNLWPCSLVPFPARPSDTAPVRPRAVT